MVVFVVRFCFVTTAFSGTGTAETPAVPGGPGVLSVPCGTWTRSRWTLVKAFRSFPGDFRAGFSAFLPGVFLFGPVSVFSFPLFGLVVAPLSFFFVFCSARSGRVFFWPCLLYLASFSLGQQHCRKSGCNGPGPCRPSF